ncbi:BSD domain-containing protein 1-like isoform X2 [Oratosquilla oratoria]|uniref:BSD domain-containing protein 1-like isoform X2 n=1 Tax=Oratosquilla oratoria TaxID=337810 RepID=UPI003F771FCB
MRQTENQNILRSSDGSWWGWIQNAKDKVVSQSAEVYEFVKKDIDEFTKVVSEEASSVVSSTATVLKEKLKLDEDNSAAHTMKKSVSGFLSHVQEVFTPPPDDEDQEAIVIRNHQPVILDRLQAAVYAVCQDPATFLTDPEGEEQQYEQWLLTFDLETRQSELSDLLVNNQALRQQYTKLVPAQVSHIVFWHRYFYKIQSLENADRRRQELKKRAEETKTADSDLVWDDDEEFGGDEEIPEHIQDKLLEDYQKECEEKERKTSSKDLSELDTCDTEEKLPDAEKVESSQSNEKIEELNVDVGKDQETTSKPSPTSTESNEDEWEKVEAADTDSSPEKSSQSKSNTPQSTEKDEEWVNWE